MLWKRLLFVLLLVTALIVPERAVAQEHATIQALATVVSSLSIVGINDLQFGTVTPSVDKSVDKAEPGFAGEWEITGTAGVEISLDFALPDSLIHQLDSIGLRIDFTNTDVSYDDGSGGQLSPTGVIDPNGPTAADLGGGGQLFVWIGGTVFPAIAQTHGDYAADIVLTVAYTGS